MSEAAKILIDKAAAVQHNATQNYERSHAEIIAIKSKETKRYNTLIDAAQDICEHEEIHTPETRRCGTHGRDEETFSIVTCSICSKYLRKEYR